MSLNLVVINRHKTMQHFIYKYADFRTEVLNRQNSFQEFQADFPKEVLKSAKHFQKHLGLL